MPNVNPLSSVNELLLTELAHYGPVTALRFAQNRLFVGYGPYLKVFSCDDAVSLVASVQVFKRNKIHSITVLADGESVAVAGGRSFAVVEIADFLAGKPVVEKAINEWIVACALMEDELLLLTSHNEVLRVALPSFSLKEKVRCSEVSILYSGSITITNDGRVLVAAGTVMSGVLVWDLHSRRILHNLTDHEGSIFGVKIDSHGQYIVSCSDDRSVKLYDFPSGRLLASGWGHGSRIWLLDFVETAHDVVTLFSTGEDCTARLWTYILGNELLTQTEFWDNCHLGKHIWSGDVDSERKLTATGGADGKVRLHDISHQHDVVTEYSPEAISLSSGVKFAAKEVIKQFAELPEVNVLIVMTSLENMFTRCGDKWTAVDLPMKKDNLILRQFTSDAVAVVSKLGDQLILSFNGTTEPTPVFVKSSFDPKYKIINAFAVTTNDTAYLIMDSPHPQAPLLFSSFTKNYAFAETLSLPKPNPRVFIPTTMHLDSTNSWLFVGSRHSNFAVYDLKAEEPSPHVFWKLCPGDTITSISTVELSPGECVVLVTNRDGIYLYVRFSISGGQFHHEIVLQNKLSKGFIEGGFVNGSELLLYGFRSSAFYLWNETRQIEIAHEVCGGAHRKWTFIRGSNTQTFAYISKSTLVLKAFSSRFESAGLLVEGTHGREIRGVALSNFQESDGSRLIVTASEDATVMLGNLNDKGEVKYQWTMNNHISGLQTVSFLSSDYVASSAANEELLIWRITRLSGGVVAMTEECRMEPSEKNPDLRIMDFASIECDNGFWVASVYSNSKVKLFFYDTTSRAFSLVAHATYSTFCILNVNFIESNDKTYLMVGTTDGNITIWDVTSNLTVGEVTELAAPVIKQQLHQSGVKAALVVPEESGWTLLTGGDDNALISSTLQLSEGTLTLTVDTFVEEAASATITGIAFAGNKRILVTSVDQIVRLWSYDQGLTCRSASYTTVADTGCCSSTSFEDRWFGAIGGAGLSIWEWK